MKRMNSRLSGVAIFVITVIVGSSAIVASNMAFKFNKLLAEPGTYGSASGTQDLGLPFKLLPTLLNASDLREQILSYGPNTVSVSRYNPIRRPTR